MPILKKLIQWEIDNIHGWEHPLLKFFDSDQSIPFEIVNLSLENLD